MIIWSKIIVKMLSDIVSGNHELIEMVSSSPENGSESGTIQNEKKGSISNLKKRVASLQKKQKKSGFSVFDTFDSIN